MPHLARPIPPFDFHKKIMRKITFCPIRGCWLLGKPPKSPHANGYRTICIGGVTYPAHRAAYAHTYGDPAPELYIDHMCEVKRCCNPLHLKAVEPRENNERAQAQRSASCARWRASKSA